MPQNDFLTVKEVSAELKMNPRTVRRLFNTGQLRGRKIGGKYIITREALKAYINAE